MLVNNAGSWRHRSCATAAGSSRSWRIIWALPTHGAALAGAAPREGRAGGVAVVEGQSRAGIDFEDPHFERRPYDKWRAYGQSKTANALFA